MTQAGSPPRSTAASRDLTARQAVVAACLAMVAITAVDLIGGKLDLLFSVGFILIVITVPMSVDVRGLFPAGVLPPLLLVGTLLAVCIIAPDAIQVDGMAKDANTIARLIAGTIDHGVTLLIGHGLALVIIALRILTDGDRLTGRDTA